MTVKLLTEHHLEFLNLIRGCTGSSESTLVKTPHCWKSHVTTHLYSDTAYIVDEYNNSLIISHGVCCRGNQFIRHEYFFFSDILSFSSNSFSTLDKQCICVNTQ